MKRVLVLALAMVLVNSNFSQTGALEPEANGPAEPSSSPV